MYDLERAFRSTRLGKKEFDRIKREARKDFPRDDLQYELHVIRRLLAKRGIGDKQTVGEITAYRHRPRTRSRVS